MLARFPGRFLGISPRSAHPCSPLNGEERAETYHSLPRSDTPPIVLPPSVSSKSPNLSLADLSPRRGSLGAHLCKSLVTSIKRSKAACVVDRQSLKGLVRVYIDDETHARKGWELTIIVTLSNSVVHTQDNICEKIPPSRRTTRLCWMKSDVSDDETSRANTWTREYRNRAWP